MYCFGQRRVWSFRNVTGGQAGRFPHSDNPDYRAESAEVVRYEKYVGLHKLITYSCRTTFKREESMWMPPLYLMKPSFLNLFMKKLTRERVVPIISASVSCDTLGSIPWGVCSLPSRAINRRARAS